MYLRLPVSMQIVHIPFSVRKNTNILEWIYSPDISYGFISREDDYSNSQIYVKTIDRETGQWGFMERIVPVDELIPFPIHDQQEINAKLSHSDYPLSITYPFVNQMVLKGVDACRSAREKFDRVFVGGYTVITPETVRIAHENTLGIYWILEQLSFLLAYDTTPASMVSFMIRSYQEKLGADIQHGCQQSTPCLSHLLHSLLKSSEGRWTTAIILNEILAHLELAPNVWKRFIEDF